MDVEQPAGPVVGILGGTGDLGRALAQRLAASGLPLLLGSRDAERAVEAAEQVAAVAAGLAGNRHVVQVRGVANDACAQRGEVVVVAVPWAGHAELLAGLAGTLVGKVVVDCVVPLGFDEHGPHALAVPEGSACQQAAGLLPDSRVVGAFHHLPAAHLLSDPSAPVDADVLVVGDDPAAVAVATDLAGRLAGARGLHAGGLRDARQVESLTANLIAMNRRYRAHAGLRVTGLPDGD